MIRDKSYVKIGGTKKNLHKLLKKAKRSRTKKQIGAACGCEKTQNGGKIMKPAEYYGGNSGRYFSSGSKELIPADGDYGKTRAVSFGMISDDKTTTGPNLGPYPKSSCSMIGGKRSKKHMKTYKKKNRSNKNKRRNTNKKHKK